MDDYLHAYILYNSERHGTPADTAYSKPFFVQCTQQDPSLRRTKTALSYFETGRWKEPSCDCSCLETISTYYLPWKDNITA